MYHWNNIDKNYWLMDCSRHTRLSLKKEQDGTYIVTSIDLAHLTKKTENIGGFKTTLAAKDAAVKWYISYLSNKIMRMKHELKLVVAEFYDVKKYTG